MLLLLRMYQILFASRLSTTSTSIVYGLSTTPIRTLIRYAIFSQTGPPRQVDYLAPLWEYRRKVSLQGHYDTLSNSETEVGADNLASAYLRFYLLSCTIANSNESDKVSFPRTQQRVMPSVGIKLAILQLLFGAL